MPDRRLGEPDRRGDLGVGLAAVLLELLDDAPVDPSLRALAAGLGGSTPTTAVPVPAPPPGQ
ncbi:MAG TPA: hypothetical protein VNC61_15065 [Acidimicrobiales bacterium]|nr:hypothetical protein [Acidimicrobiales bacterium]